MLSDNWLLYSSQGVLADSTYKTPIAPITLVLAQTHYPITIRLVPSLDEPSLVR
jgi:hypothetical protein